VEGDREERKEEMRRRSTVWRSILIRSWDWSWN
jgi:hypothetical protein